MSKNGKMFEWDFEQIEKFVQVTDNDEAVQTSRKIIEKLAKKLGHAPKVLEAGSGNGRVVLYLSRLGYKNISGVEINEEIVKSINKHYPDLKIYAGNILSLEAHLLENDLVLSYGVVEHFIDGLKIPMEKMYESIKAGGYAVVTVPCYSLQRKIKSFFDKKLQKIIRTKEFKFFPFFLNNEFYEYRLTKKEFFKECQKVGFEVVLQKPTQNEGGFFEFINPKNKRGHFVWTEDGLVFKYSPIGKMIKKITDYFPYFCNHMQMCVLKKKDFKFKNEENV